MLLSPFNFGEISLKHRIVMPPLTRMRAGQGDGIPSELAKEYYAQRASKGGLIIAEATQISQQGQGYPGTPGIYTQDQIDGWRSIVEAVKQKGGVIFLQLWHVGRLSHSSFHENKTAPVGPSAIKPAGNAFTKQGKRTPFETPRPLEHAEITKIVDDYKRAAENARNAGFDGIEIHAANGYLLEQFMASNTNIRTDQYGGSVENRSRLLFEVIDAVSEIWPKNRIGVRLSPFSDVGDISDENPSELYKYLIESLSKIELAYLHLIEPEVRAGLTEELNKNAPVSVTALYRKSFDGPLIASGGFNRESAEKAIEVGMADMIAFGRAFIANPDLPDRFATKSQLNKPDSSTFYVGGARGYTDYPTLEQTNKSH